MAVEFDAKLWRKRARTKKNRRNSTLQSDYALIRKISVIVDWAETRGLTVQFSRHGSYTKDSLINISSHSSLQTQFLDIIHECGHQLIGDRKPNQRYGKGYPFGTIYEARTLVQKVDILDEEAEAWNRGFRLAARLGVPPHRGTYDVYRAKMVASYARLV